MSETEEAPSPTSQTKKEEPAASESPDTSIVEPTPQPAPALTPSNCENEISQQVAPPATPAVVSAPSSQSVSNTNVPEKTLVKPGVLRFGTQEDSLLNVPSVASISTGTVARAATSTPPAVQQTQPQNQPQPLPQPQQQTQIPASVQLPTQSQPQPPQPAPQNQPPQQQPQIPQNIPQVPQQPQAQIQQIQQSPSPQSTPVQTVPCLPQQPPTPQSVPTQATPPGLIQQPPAPLLIATQQAAHAASHIPQTQPCASPQVPKVPQFKVKPASALMPEDKKPVKTLGHKKKSRKSPAGSPHPHPIEPPPLGLEGGGREDVQSPAYSDISDDAAPLLEAEVEANKAKASTGEKKVEVGPGQSPHYGMYPYYGQPPYLVPSVTDNKAKEISLENKSCSDKEKKENSGPTANEYPQKMLPQHFYPPYGYVPGYPYNLESGYSVAMMTSEDKGNSMKEEKSPGPTDISKQSHPPAPQPIHVPNPNKIKTEPGMKDKPHQNENHQILKESIEMKNQMNPAFLYSRQHQQQAVQQQQQQQAVQQQHQQQHVVQQQQQQQQAAHQQQQQQQQDEMRRYYIYSEPRRKDHGSAPPEAPLKATPPPQQKQNLPIPSPKHKEKQTEEKKEEKVKQEGVKPTMETQGPPPPPTSSYAYIHPGYMQSPHYGTIPFDPGHAVYRGMNPMLVPGPYANSPYLHPQLHAQIPRYHAPEDLSRPPAGAPKALDLLQHHANQYYSSHKIHELQERAMKSPTPKTATASASPSGGVQNSPMVGTQGPPVSVTNSTPVQQQAPKQTSAENKDSRSPPPQRHVHTHHHTHVGLGYPILAGQYPAPYGGKPL